jgi:hypothetical protein
VGAVGPDVDGSAGGRDSLEACGDLLEACVDSLAACGDVAGGRSDRVDLLEEPSPACAAGRRECLGVCLSLLVDPAALLPGNACAAASAKRAVRATLAAISQRLILLNLRSELSRECVL